MTGPIIAVSHDPRRTSDSSDALEGLVDRAPVLTFPNIRPGPDVISDLVRPLDVLGVAQAQIDAGVEETPLGSNVTVIGEWYGVQDEWCAMFVSFCLAHGGFSDDGGETCNVPGLTQTTSKGWAFVPYMRDSFSPTRRFSAPEVGDIFCINSSMHTGLVTEVRDHTFISAEGNFEDRTANNERSIDSCYYLRPPYVPVRVASGLGPEFLYGRPGNEAFLFDSAGRVHTRLTSGQTLDALRTAGVPDAGVRPEEVHRELVTIAQRGGFSG
jgi:hypothetical protein